jgi:hypothetical protein
MNTDPRDDYRGIAPPEPPRTIDRSAQPERPPTPAALTVLAALVRETEGDSKGGTMPAPHAGERFSQRQLARKILAGRSYQAVQAWLGGEPVPKVTADWLLEDLARIDAREVARSIVLQDDEIAIVVRR